MIPGPTYDRATLTPGIVHVGVGQFHRSHQAVYVDRLLAAGCSPGWGIAGVGVLETDRAMAEALRRQDGCYTLVLKHPDGTMEARTIGSICDFVLAVDGRGAALDRMADPGTAIVTLTITEGGYGPGSPALALLVDALGRRRRLGRAPFTVVSCDNIEGNGAVARRAVVGYAKVAAPDLAPWIEHEVCFPNSMVDRITPAATDADRRLVCDRWGIDDAIPVVAEPFTQWVLEDDFGDGRPPFEAAGVQLVGDVRPYELMKLRLLNGSHQALAYFGALLGHHFVHDAAADPLLAGLVQRYMEEATPTLEPVPGVDIDAYRATLLERFTNPGIADTVARLAAFSSDRIPTWIVPVVVENLAAGRPVRWCAAVIASWAHHRAVATAVVDRRDAHLGRGAALLDDVDLFGDLGDNREFRAAFDVVLDDLQMKGPAAALTAALDRA